MAHLTTLEAARHQTLLDTARLNDALACGYNVPTRSDEGGLKVTAEAHEALGPCVVLYGLEGEVSLTGDAEIEAVIRALQMARSQASALSKKAA